MVFCPEHNEQDQNLKFTPLSATMSIPAPFIWEFSPLGGLCCAATALIAHIVSFAAARAGVTPALRLRSERLRRRGPFQLLVAAFQEFR